MPTAQYPFIDIAVHDKVRDHFVVGEAVVVFSQSLETILWVNGAGARLFGHDGLYEFMDEGLNSATTAFRQLQSASRNLSRGSSGNACNLVIRTGTGFRRPLTSARLEPIVLADGNNVLLLTAPVSEPANTPDAQAACILDGFEDMDSHAAVLDRNGAVLGATTSFDRLRMDASVREKIVNDVSGAFDRLIKHPVQTALGLLPAAIARVSDEPTLHLLFAVEMSIGNLDPQPGETARIENKPILLDDPEETTTGKAPETIAETPEKPVLPAKPIPSVLNMVPDEDASAYLDHVDENDSIETDSAPFTDSDLAKNESTAVSGQL